MSEAVILAGLEAIVRVVDLVRAHKAGEITASDALARIETIASNEASADAAGDAAIAAKRAP
jgi:hypothetical protein